jgi:hypothetical protein
MPRHARLGDADDAGELGDVEGIGGQEAQHAEADLVAEQPEQAGGRTHIH